MSRTEIVIATGLATAIVAFTAGWLTARRTNRRLRTELADLGGLLDRDELTGLLNRSGLRTAHATLVETEPAQSLLVLLIDLDDFKPVNDLHGHGVGDQLLAVIGNRISAAAAARGGVAARLSGDEFAALLPIRDPDLATIADTFVDLVAQPVKLGGERTTVTVTVTASVGAALVDTSDPFEDVVLRRADTAMYHAKHHGGNRHAIYQPGMTMPPTQPRHGARPRELHRRHRDVTA